MGRGHNHRHPAVDILKDGFGKHFALCVREQKLLREVSENALAVGAGIEHEIDATLLACQIEIATFCKRGGHNRETPLNRADRMLDEEFMSVLFGIQE